MMKKVLFPASAVALAIIIHLSIVSLSGQVLECWACEGGGVVNKTPCEAFTVKITFKNTGKAEGVWSVNIAFEGELWTWSGTPQTISLKPSKSETLTWNGNVPCNAPAGSIARLIVYYNDSFKPLNWWIFIVSSAELTITASQVR
jgi:hypothetical protein